MIELLALDFDGVIVDSAAECFLVAVETLASLRPGSPIIASRRQPPRGPLQPPQPGDPVFFRFVESMPLGNRAEDFAVALAAIERAVPLPDQSAFDRFKASIDPEWLRRFHARFYEIREAFQRRDPEGWLALLPPYPEVVAALRELGGTIRLAIATARDRRSVSKILDASDLDSLFPDELLLDKETGISKRAHLTELLERTGVPPGRTAFVDDKVSHLESAAALGITAALASWGFNGAREYRLARKLGFPILKPPDLPRIIRR